MTMNLAAQHTTTTPDPILHLYTSLSCSPSPYAPLTLIFRMLFVWSRIFCIASIVCLPALVCVVVVSIISCIISSLSPPIVKDVPVSLPRAVNPPACLPGYHHQCESLSLLLSSQRVFLVEAACQEDEMRDGWRMDGRGNDSAYRCWLVGWLVSWRLLCWYCWLTMVRDEGSARGPLQRCR